MSKAINVYSEIGKLRKVLVHTPGKEIEYITPKRLDELLFSAILEPEQARKEHQEFCKILEDQGVEVVQLVDLVVETWNKASDTEKEAFIQRWLDESSPKLSVVNRPIIDKYIHSLSKEPKKMVQTMMSGILAKEVGINSDVELIVDPMPNLYFTRDPFASVGNGVTIHNMRHVVRRRETIFCDFVFKCNPEYKDVPRYYDRTDAYSIEGGDVFIYNETTLAIGVSERTDKEAITLLAQKIKANPDAKFKTILAINVPKMGNLMHLDTWLTMLDTNKFLYSPNVMGVLKLWTIDLTKPTIEWVESSDSLESFLEKVVGSKVVLIPIAGENATQIDIDIETHFDGTNYVVVSPGVVVGYNRNKKTEAALKKAGIKVLSWNGNQLSLGMGSARCMTMPLIREEVKK